MSHVLLYFLLMSGNFSGVSWNIIFNEQNFSTVLIHHFYDIWLSDAVHHSTWAILSSFFFLFCRPLVFVTSAFVERYGKVSHVLLYFRHVSGNFSGFSLNVISNEQNFFAFHIHQFYETGLSDAVKSNRCWSWSGVGGGGLRCWLHVLGYVILNLLFW